MNTPFSSILSNQYVPGVISEAFWDSLLFSEARRIINAANSGFSQAAFNEALSFARLYESAIKRGKATYGGVSTENVFAEYTGVANMIASTFGRRVSRNYFGDFRRTENDPAGWADVFNYWADTWFHLNGSGAKTMDGVDFRGWMVWLPCMLPIDTSRKRNIVNYYLANNEAYFMKIKETFNYDLKKEWTSLVLNENMRPTKMNKKSGGMGLPLFENFVTKNPANMATDPSLTKDVDKIISAFHQAYPDGVDAKDQQGWFVEQVFRKLIEALMDDAAATGFTSHIKMSQALASFFEESIAKYGKVFMMGENSVHEWLYSKR